MWEIIGTALLSASTGFVAGAYWIVKYKPAPGVDLDEEDRREVSLTLDIDTAGFDAARRVVTLATTKTTGRAQIPVGRIAAKLLARPAFTVDPNEASTLFAKLCRQLLITGLTFHDSRATALTLLAKRVDVLTLAKISRHKDLSLLMNTYYRESEEEIAARI